MDDFLLEAWSDLILSKPIAAMKCFERTIFSQTVLASVSETQSRLVWSLVIRDISDAYDLATLAIGGGISIHRYNFWSRRA